MMRTLKWGLAVLAYLGLSASAHAQDAAKFPERPITIVVAFSPGGSTDVLARQLSADLGKALGTSIVVENRPGASGYIAWRHVAQSPADGYTLLLAENALAINTALQTDRSFDPRKAFAPVAMVATAPVVLLQTLSMEPNSVKELADWANKNPGKLTFSSSGIGSVSHMTYEAFAAAAGFKAEHVPFKGGGEAVSAVVGGHVHTMLNTLASAKKLVDAKSVKALANTDENRSPSLPDVPTIKELGLTPEVELRFWWGIFAPAGLPDAIKEKLSSGISKVLADQAVRDRLTGLDVTPAFAPADVLKEKLETEITNWSGFIQKAGIKVE